MSKQQKSSPKKKFESDTAKVVRRHLSDPNHVISEEEMAGVRIGMAPSADESIQEEASYIADKRAGSESNNVSG